MGHGPALPGSRCRDAPASGRDLLAESTSAGARPTHLCLLHKERLRCDPAQAAVWRLRLAVLELQHIARAAAADSPRIGQPERSTFSTGRASRGDPGPGARRRAKPRPARRQHFYIAPSRLLQTRLLPFRSPGEASRGSGAGGDREGSQNPVNAPEVGQIRPSASPLLGAPGAYWREATGARRTKLNLQQLLAVPARLGESLLGLSAPQEFTWYSRRTDEIPRVLARAGTPSFMQMWCETGLN